MPSTSASWPAPPRARRCPGFIERQPGHALGHFYYAMSLWNAKAVSLDRRLAKARFQLGALYSDQRRYPEAAAALEEAARLEPGMAQAHYRLAQVYRRLGREDLARRALEAFERLQQREQAPPAPPPGDHGR